VVIDEVQKVPALLDEVHGLMETRGTRFVLSGSSARKLRRGASNLLAGRAVVEHLYPLTSAETGWEGMGEASLERGTLPMAITSADPVAYLTAYAQTYLQEEIRAEALTRDIGDFSRFLAAPVEAEIGDPTGCPSEILPVRRRSDPRAQRPPALPAVTGGERIPDGDLDPQ
jgi:predicted AAA+ superfamily ATPase